MTNRDFYPNVDCNKYSIRSVPIVRDKIMIIIDSVFFIIYYLWVKASFIANSAKTLPAILFRIFSPFLVLLNQEPIFAARKLIEPKTTRAQSIKMKPNKKICKVKFPFCGFVNCGKNAKKKTDTFGFVIFINIPLL